MIRYIILITSLVYAGTAFAEVGQFVFTTNPQSISVGVVSDVMTVQSQDSSGVTENITETNDVVFTSTSQTGEFLSTSGNPVTTTMSKNTANKNFLYRDSTAGTYTITATFTGRTSLKTFSASQQVDVGGSGSGISGNTNSSTTSQTTTQTSVTVTTPLQVSVSSAHSSPAPLSTIENKIDFEISAGRDRLVMVGSAVNFKASATKTQNLSEQNILYSWSFGDGTVGLGNDIVHTYRFPGNYTVVVNGSFSDKQAVSKILVKVISPDVSIEGLSGGVSIFNKSKSEINLEGWTLSNGDKKFIFPKDTLMPAGEKVVFASEVIGFSGDNVRLVNPLGREFASFSSPTLVRNIENTKVDLKDIQAKVDEVKNTIAKIQIEIKSSSLVTKEKVAQVKKEEPHIETIVLSNKEELANVIQATDITKSGDSEDKKSGWFSRSFGFIKRLFISD